MRECRGKRVDNGEWAYGWYCLDNFGQGWIYDPEYGTPISDSALWFKVIPKTVGEYVGKKDKNSKKIYGGDICEHTICERNRYIEANGSIDGALIVIEYKNTAWGFSPVYPDLQHEDDVEWRSFWRDTTIDDMWESNKMKIIGNTHEHP